MIEYHKHLSVIEEFKKKTILVIGDCMLDVYLKGSSTRLSPEAPVPVVDVTEKINFLGGSANTVCNLYNLGAQVRYCTVIGDDPEGKEITSLLEKINIEQSCIVQHAARKTLVKTRVMAGNHTITRIDSGTKDNIDSYTAQRLVEYISTTGLQADAIVVSDYDKGIITDEIIDVLTDLRRKGKFIAVDSKRLPFFKRLLPSFVKPNYDETIKLLSLPFNDKDRHIQLTGFGEKLTEITGAKTIAVTLDKEGSIILNKGKAVAKNDAANVSLPHVAGAGDTFLSTYTLSYTTCLDPKLSSALATAAAEIAIRKESTSTCTEHELRSYYKSNIKHINSNDELRSLCETYRTQGKKIVFTNGCFDILHSGHVTYLHCARQLGDVLIVGVNNDLSIKRLKGDSRPINPLADRLHVLSGLESVDHVVTFGSAGDDTPVPLIEIVKPHVFAKGGDYTKDKLPEADTVEKFGGEIVFLPHIPSRSTTNIIQRINGKMMVTKTAASKAS